MNQKERQTVLAVCKRTSELMDEIQPTLIRWALGGERVPKAFNEAMRSLGKGAEKLPTEWRDMTLGQVAACSVIRDPREIGRYLGDYGKALSADSVAFLEMLMEQSAFLTAFSAEEDLGDNLFEIKDFSSDSTHVLYSPALAALFREKAQSHFTLLFSNGACLQALGTMHYYRGFEAIDFHFYAKMLRPQSYEAQGLSALMTAMPERFVILDFFF